MTHSIAECKKLLTKLAIKYQVPSKLISERLLSLEDKEDMLNGLVPFETLEAYVKAWRFGGMCNYADGTGDWYKHFWLYQTI